MKKIIPRLRMEKKERCGSGATWAAAIVVVVILAAIASVYVVETQDGGWSHSSSAVTSYALSTSTQSPGNGLELHLTMNATHLDTGEGITTTVDEVNARPAPLNISYSNEWPIQGLALSACGSVNLPIGVAVLSGKYDLSNVSSGKVLSLYPPGVYGCPAMFTISGYVFQASSDNATIVIGGCQPSNCTSERVNSSVSINGYWTGGGTLRSFPQGVYTVVAGDEWGGLAILHFEVSGREA